MSASDRAARTCTCYGKLTHKGRVYVYDNANVCIEKEN